MPLPRQSDSLRRDDACLRRDYYLRVVGFRLGARVLVPLCAAALAVALTFWRPVADGGTEGALAPGNEARLPSQGDNVVAVAVDLSARDGDGLDQANLSVIARVDAFIRSLEGVRGYSSPLRATVVRATADDISARPFVPPDLVDAYDPATAQELRRSYPLFPEIHPYWSADLRTVAFYLELGSRIPPATLVARLEELQRTLEAEGVELHFTGLRPIAVEVGRLMTRDVRALLPFAGVLIAAVFLLTFGSVRGVLLALAATGIAAGIGYAVFTLLAAAATPLLVLLPVFAGGLLSDYVIHTGYHLGSFGDGSPRAARSYLGLPLALTAATTVIGFLSLVGLGSDAHVFVGVTVSAGALAALVLALWWVPAFGPIRGRARAGRGRALTRLTTRRIRRVLVVAVLALARYRVLAAVILAAAAGLAGLNLHRLRVEPYPLHQLPEASTIVRAERLFNGKFAGTVPFAIELDAGEPNAFVRREPLERLASIHRSLAESGEVGHHQSLLTVVERINSYFTDGDPASRRLPDVQDPDAFERLVSQYLLFFAASASPAAYDALTDSDFSVARLHGIIRYRDFETLRRFQDRVEALRGELPDGWTLRVSGPVQDLLQHAARLRNGWLRTFGSGALLIFLTVLAAFRDLRLAVLSLLPPCVVLLAVAGAAPLFGVHLDDYTVIAIAVTLGLTVDYTIHVINALRRSPAAARRTDAGATGRIRLAIAVARGSGVPVFMSFLTSVVAFLSLAISSFAGAVHFGMMIAAAIAGAFVLSLFIATWELPASQGRNR